MLSVRDSPEYERKTSIFTKSVSERERNREAAEERIAKTSLLSKKQDNVKAAMTVRFLEILYNDIPEYKIQHRTECIRDIYCTENLRKQEMNVSYKNLTSARESSDFIEDMEVMCRIGRPVIIHSSIGIDNWNPADDSTSNCLDTVFYIQLYTDAETVSYKCNEWYYSMQLWNESFIHAIAKLVSYENADNPFSAKANRPSGMTDNEYKTYKAQLLQKAWMADKDNFVFLPDVIPGKSVITTEISEHKKKARELLAEIIQMHNKFMQRLSTIESRDPEEWLEVQRLPKDDGIRWINTSHGSSGMFCRSMLVDSYRKRYGELLKLYKEFGVKSGKYLDSMKTIYKLLSDRDDNSIKSIQSLVNDMDAFQCNMHDHVKGEIAAHALYSLMYGCNDFIDDLGADLTTGDMFRVLGIDTLNKLLNTENPGYAYDPERQKQEQDNMNECTADYLVYLFKLILDQI